MTAPRSSGDGPPRRQDDPTGESPRPAGKAVGIPTSRDSALGIDPAQLARLGSLPIQARVIVEGALSGLHRAAVHGASVEFAEHKEYSPGDELRHVDWKAYAKLDRYYVKQFEQESQLTVYLVLDASASMAFAGGGIAKLAYAGLSLAALAYLVIQQQDKVGLIACGDKQLETLVPPRARTTHLHDLMSVLESILTRAMAQGLAERLALGFQLFTDREVFIPGHVQLPAILRIGDAGFLEPADSIVHGRTGMTEGNAEVPALHPTRVQDKGLETCASPGHFFGHVGKIQKVILV